ncbi:MAG: arginine deiminase family protein [Candidatus Micrarchaeaceae archaeon]
MMGRINAEWSRLKKVVVHKPGIEAFFGLLNPSASLYERPFNRYKARAEHDTMAEALKDDFGVNVKYLDIEILNAADRHKKIKEELERSASKSLKFEGNRENVALGKSTFKSWMEYYDSNQFFDILLLRPTIAAVGHKPKGTKPAYAKVAPLSNMYFMRDQQIVSDKGVFMSNMLMPQRKPETEITELLWKAMGLPISGKAHSPATIEGGDFIPMGNFALIGIGSRTNKLGVKQFLSKGCRYDEIAVVHRPKHPLIRPGSADMMIDMHLDTYFNAAGSSIVVGSAELMKQAQVDIYSRISKGGYSMERQKQNLYEYISSKGFNIIGISLIEQLSYASNFLCIKDGTILAADSKKNMPLVLMDLGNKAEMHRSTYGTLFKEARKEYQKLKAGNSVFPNGKAAREFGIDFKSIDIENLTGGYGGIHCMTAAIERS